MKLKDIQIRRIEEAYPNHIDIADLLNHIKQLELRLERYEKALKIITFPASIGDTKELIDDYIHLVNTAKEALEDVHT